MIVGLDPARIPTALEVISKIWTKHVRGFWPSQRVSQYDEALKPEVYSTTKITLGVDDM